MSSTNLNYNDNGFDNLKIIHILNFVLITKLKINKYMKITLLIFVLLISSAYHCIASDDLKFRGLYYISYENEVVASPSINKFRINRAYFTVEKGMFDFLDSRLTLDVYDDDDGVEARLKYIYVRFKFDSLIKSDGIVNNLNIKFGMIHTPWIDFEEHINFYRMQGTVFIERVGLTPSSDFGANLNGLIGGLIDEEYRKNVNPYNAGKYGSFDFGLFNGAGYNRFELNDNKVLQGKLTIRPLPFFIPGLQLSVLGITGRGNYVDELKNSPKWDLSSFMLSYENKYITLIGLICKGKGDFQGLMIDSNKEAIPFSGASIFGEIKLDKFKFFTRFDYFMPDEFLEKFRSNRMIIALGYDFGKKNILLLDYDHHWKLNNDIKLLKLTMQFVYN